MVEHVSALFPADPQIASGEEAGHQVTAQVVDPPLFGQLAHHSVYGWELRIS